MKLGKEVECFKASNPTYSYLHWQAEVTEDKRRKRPIVRIAESPERDLVVEVCHLPDSPILLCQADGCAEPLCCPCC